MHIVSLFSILIPIPIPHFDTDIKAIHIAIHIQLYCPDWGFFQLENRRDLWSGALHTVYYYCLCSNYMQWQCKKLGKIFTGPTYKLLLSFNIQVVFICLQVLYSKWSCIYQVLSYSVDFQASQEHWNPVSKALPGKFHRSGGPSIYAPINQTEPIFTDLRHGKFS